MKIQRMIYLINLKNKVFFIKNLMGSLACL